MTISINPVFWDWYQHELSLFDLFPQSTDDVRCTCSCDTCAEGCTAGGGW